MKLKIIEIWINVKQKMDMNAVKTVNDYANVTKMLQNGYEIFL